MVGFVWFVVGLSLSFSPPSDCSFLPSMMTWAPCPHGVRTRGKKMLAPGAHRQRWHLYVYKSCPQNGRHMSMWTPRVLIQVHPARHHIQQCTVSAMCMVSGPPSIRKEELSRVGSRKQQTLELGARASSSTTFATSVWHNSGTGALLSDVRRQHTKLGATSWTNRATTWANVFLGCSQI